MTSSAAALPEGALASETAGLGNKTASSWDLAWRLYLDHKAKTGEQFADFKAEMDELSSNDNAAEAAALMGEAMQNELLSFSTTLREDDIKNRSNQNASTKTVSLAQYFGQVKERLKLKYPTLPIRTNHDTTWYKTMLERVRNGVQSRLLTDDDELVQPSIRALVKRSDRPDMVQLQHRHTPETSWDGYWKDLPGKDLESMLRQMMREASDIEHPFEARFMLVMLCLAGGRGGEPKFIKWAQLYWDDYFHNVTGIWTQVKVLNQKDVPFCPDFDNYIADFYHLLLSGAGYFCFYFHPTKVSLLYFSLLYGTSKSTHFTLGLLCGT